MTVCRAPEDIVQLLQDRVVGKTVRDLEVHGINSLKSVNPTPGDLAGQEVLAAALVAQTQVEMRLSSAVALIDLQRAATAEYRPKLMPWTFQQGSQPTLRLLLADGSGLDFRESSRTKRITLLLTSISI